MKVLDYKGAHKMVEGSTNVSWDGYDMVFFDPTPAGWSHVKGEYRNGRWGIAHRVTVTTKGTWYVSNKLARLLGN